MIRKTMAVLTLALFVVSAAGLALAGEKKGDMDTMHGEHVKFQGKLVCLGCSLKKAEGARAECSEYGHTHALMTADGKYINFLPNRYSDALMKGGKFDNQEITVEGTYFADADVLDVEMYEVDGQKYSWCDHCKAMDGCKFAKGDM